MEWVLNHLQFIIAVAGAVAWWLTQRKQAQAEGDEPPQKEVNFGDPELAERTRRIREEIQRKIAQRSRDYTPPDPTRRGEEAPQASPPVIRPEFPEIARAAGRPAEPPPLSRTAATHLEAQRTAEILAQQAALYAQLKQVQEVKAEAMRRTQFETHVSGEVGAAAVARSALADDLRSPDALRRALIMREILGPPVALRS